MKKSVTLVELLIAMSLLGVIVLGAASFDLASRRFLISSERKTEVLNEMTYVLEHVNKWASRAHGWIDNPGIEVPSGTELRIRYDVIDSGSGKYTPDNFGDDLWAKYQVVGYELRFFADETSAAYDVLTKRIITMTFERVINSGGVYVHNLQLQYDPDAATEERDNPRVTMDIDGQDNEVFFASSSHSWN